MEVTYIAKYYFADKFGRRNVCFWECRPFSSDDFLLTIKNIRTYTVVAIKIFHRYEWPPVFHDQSNKDYNLSLKCTIDYAIIISFYKFKK